MGNFNKLKIRFESPLNTQTKGLNKRTQSSIGVTTTIATDSGAIIASFFGIRSANRIKIDVTKKNSESQRYQSMHRHPTRYETPSQNRGSTLAHPKYRRELLHR